MDSNYSKFYKRMIVRSKAEADFLNWLVIGFFVGFVYHFIPAPYCPSPVLDDEFGWLSTGTMCEGAHSARLSAIAWIGFSFFRIFFLASKWKAGPILKLCGLKIERQNGKPVTLGFAARYSLLEWLPFHILSLYVLIFEPPTNLYTAGSAVTFSIAAQLIWLAPVIFKYHRQNISEILTQGRIVFNAERVLKIEKYELSKWKVNLKSVEFYIDRFIYILVVTFFIFTSIQILRTPEIKPEYERLLYADREPAWENNVYFAVEGLTAPADIKDTYAYGQAKALQGFKDYETLKKLAHIPYTYEIPTNLENLPEIRKDQELKFDSENWKNLSCLFTVIPDADSNCATRQDLQSYIQANEIIWGRFNNLPNYTTYRNPPQQLGGRTTKSPRQELLLGQIKAAQIIEMAENGASEKAFQEWNKYWKLYRSMAGAQETIVFKAIIAITISEHLKAFEKLIYLDPDLAKNHGIEIAEALRSSGNTLFRTEQILSDDIGLMEPIFLAQLGNINAIRNDLYDCIINSQKKAQLPMNEYPFDEKNKLCRLHTSGLTESMFIYPIMQPGYFLSNIVENLLIGGLLKGDELVANLKLKDVHLRMALLATEIIKQEIGTEDVPAFISSAPAELQNPVTQKPFEWDAQNKALFYIRPGSDKKVEFRLNLFKKS